MIPLVNCINKYASLKKTGSISFFVEFEFVFTIPVGILFIIQGDCALWNKVFFMDTLFCHKKCQIHLFVIYFTIGL